MKKSHFLYEYVEKIFIFKFIILRWKNIEVSAFLFLNSLSHFGFGCHSFEPFRALSPHSIGIQSQTATKFKMCNAFLLSFSLSLSVTPRLCICALAFFKQLNFFPPPHWWFTDRCRRQRYQEAKRMEREEEKMGYTPLWIFHTLNRFISFRWNEMYVKSFYGTEITFEELNLHFNSSSKAHNGVYRIEKYSSWSPRYNKPKPWIENCHSKYFSTWHRLLLHPYLHI